MSVLKSPWFLKQEVLLVFHENMLLAREKQKTTSVPQPWHTWNDSHPSPIFSCACKSHRVPARRSPVILLLGHSVPWQWCWPALTLLHVGKVSLKCNGRPYKEDWSVRTVIEPSSYCVKVYLKYLRNITVGIWSNIITWQMWYCRPRKGKGLVQNHRTSYSQSGIKTQVIWLLLPRSFQCVTVTVKGLPVNHTGSQIFTFLRSHPRSKLKM